jgi:Ca2+/H+ antiporter, TMEM165/GDT1 family
VIPAAPAFWPALLAGFLASLVEFVEALTVVLAVGATRGWRGALAGSAAALATLTLVVGLLGPALAHVPLRLMQLAVGTLLLLFGMRWLRKALLRAAGVIALRDENAAYAAETAALRPSAKLRGWDGVAVATAFKITLLEGTEVVFIVLAVSAGGGGLWLAASLGALAALLVVCLLGLVLHRPLARVPENALKFGVGVLLSGFGTFWVGEGLGIHWPGRDTSAVGLLVGYLLVAALCVSWCRRRGATAGAARH